MIFPHKAVSSAFRLLDKTYLALLHFFLPIYFVFSFLFLLDTDLPFHPSPPLKESHWDSNHTGTGSIKTQKPHIGWEGRINPTRWNITSLLPAGWANHRVKNHRVKTHRRGSSLSQHSVPSESSSDPSHPMLKTPPAQNRCAN